jgi:hypothetical protein
VFLSPGCRALARLVALANLPARGAAHDHGGRAPASAVTTHIRRRPQVVRCSNPERPGASASSTRFRPAGRGRHGHGPRRTGTRAHAHAAHRTCPPIPCRPPGNPPSSRRTTHSFVAAQRSTTWAGTLAHGRAHISSRRRDRSPPETPALESADAEPPARGVDLPA